MNKSAAAMERAPGQTRLHSKQDVLVGACVLFLAAVVFSVEIRRLSLNNGWWLDELFSIWATDPSIGFLDVLKHRILPDTTPPLYYTGLYWARRLMIDERTAIIILNLGALAVALISVSVASRKAGALGWALLAGAFFLLSGPVVRYTIEGRCYVMALSITFVAAWYCALAIEADDNRPGLFSFAVIGLTAASIHLYAALICDCLAAALVGLSLFTKRRDLLAIGLVLGVSACIMTLLWLPFAMNTVDMLRWQELSYGSLLTAYSELRELVVGSHLAVFWLIGLFFIGLIQPTTRSLAAVFGLAFILFVFLPILISVKRPIIGARYWMIGAPSIVVFVSFLIRALLVGGAQGLRARLCKAGALAGLSFLVVTDISGLFTARAATAEKENWNGGGAIVGPLLQHCPQRSVHVFTSWGFVPGFAFVAHAPEELFISADAPETAWIGAEDSACPVLGWAEHVFYRGNERLKDDLAMAGSDEELLKLMKIRALASEVDIYRHKRGFVVLRRGSLAPGAN